MTPTSVPLEERLGGAPVALRERVTALMLAHGARDASGLSADSLIDAGEHALQRVLSGTMSRRDTALELLAADSLVTLAFEVAAGEGGGGDVEGRATVAMQRLADAIGGR